MATPCAVCSLEIDQWGPFALFKCEVGHSYACCSAACSKDFERLCCDVRKRCMQTKKDLDKKNKRFFVDVLNRAKHDGERLLCPGKRTNILTKFVPFCARGVDNLGGFGRRMEEEARAQKARSPVEKPTAQGSSEANKDGETRLRSPQELVLLEAKKDDLDQGHGSNPRNRHRERGGTNGSLKEGKPVARKTLTLAELEMAIPWASADSAFSRSSPDQAPGKSAIGSGDADSLEDYPLLPMSPHDSTPALKASIAPPPGLGFDHKEEKGRVQASQPAEACRSSHLLLLGPPPAIPPPPPLPSLWRAAWSAEETRYYFFDTVSRQARWEVPSDGAGSLYRCSEHVVSEDGFFLTAVQGGTFEVLDVVEHSGERSCRVRRLEEPSEEGVLPARVLKPLQDLAPKLQVGDLCVAVEAFAEPTFVRGYLGLSVGDAVEILHSPQSYVGTWAYVRRIAAQGRDEALGWVPVHGLAPTSGVCL